MLLGLTQNGHHHVADQVHYIQVPTIQHKGIAIVVHTTYLIIYYTYVSSNHQSRYGLYTIGTTIEKNKYNNTLHLCLIACTTFSNLATESDSITFLQ